MIDPNLLGDERDLAPMVRGVQLGRRIAGTAAFARYEAIEVQPGLAVQSEEAIADTCAARRAPCITRVARAAWASTIARSWIRSCA